MHYRFLFVFFRPLFGFLCLMVYLSSACYAQSREEVTEWNEQAWNAFAQTNFKEARALAQRASKRAMAEGWNMEASLGINVLGNICLAEGTPDSAIHHFQRALLLRQKIGDAQAIGWSHINISNALRTLGDLPAALTQYELAMEHLLLAGDSAEYMKAKSGWALVSMEQGRLPEALQALETCLAFYEQQGSITGLAATYLSLGNYYETTHQWSRAKTHYRQAVEYAEAIGDQEGAVNALLNTANIMMEVGDLDSAEVIYTKGARLQDSLGLLQGLAGTWINLATVNLRLENTEAAKEYAQKAYEAYRSSDDQRGMSEACIILSEAHAEPNASLFFARQALRHACQSQQAFLELNALRTLAEGFRLHHKHDSALHYLDAYTSLGDSLEQRWQQSMALQFQLESERNQRKLQDSELKRQHALLDKQEAINHVLVGVFFLLCLAAALVVYAMQQRRRRLEAVKAQREKELESVKIIANFQEQERHRVAEALHGEVGSRLSMVKTAIKSAENKMDQVRAEVSEVKSVYKKAGDDLDVVVGLVRGIAHSLDLGVLRNGLLPAINDLVALVQQNTGMSIEFDHHGLDKRFSETVEKTVYQVLQEILHNTIKHSQATEVGVSVQVIQKNERPTNLSIMVEDNGVGFDMLDPGYQPGMGLKQIRARVEAISGKINVDALRGRGTIIMVDIPLRSSENHITDGK